VFPQLLVLAAWSTRALYRLVVPAKLTRPFLATTLALFVALSAARVAALHRNFGGLLALHKDLNDQLLLSLAKGENSNLGVKNQIKIYYLNCL
jgi:hypothetical protein